jgi:hypothetical protein
MLGLEDNWVALAFVLCLASSALCVVYGFLNRNRGDDAIDQADIRWAAEEDKAEEKL